ncbi:MAG TPA: hypothetical protein VGO62_15145 [Myxococcota bacterium]
MKHTIGILVLAAAPALVGGCMESRTYENPNQNGPSPFTTPSNLAVSGGHLQGDIGTVKGFDDNATLTEGATDGYQSSYVKVQSDKTAGTGMVILNLYGVNLNELKLGQTAFTNFNSNTSMYALGCSGQNASNIDYDQPADHGTVTVAQGVNGTRQVTVHGEWTQDASGNTLTTPSVATGSFTYQP